MKMLMPLFVLGLVAGSITLRAQMPIIPFDKIERDSQAQRQGLAHLIGATNDEGSSSISSIPAAGMVTLPRNSAIEPHVVDRDFILLHGIHLGMAMFDVGLTQHCIANYQCKEGNPLMPASMAGQLGVTLGLFASSAGGSYYLKKHRSRAWWVPPFTGMVGHTVGVASGLAH
jgi:hypothetical protein